METKKSGNHTNTMFDETQSHHYDTTTIFIGIELHHHRIDPLENHAVYIALFGTGSYLVPKMTIFGKNLER